MSVTHPAPIQIARRDGRVRRIKIDPRPADEFDQWILNVERMIHRSLCPRDADVIAYAMTRRLTAKEVADLLNH